MSSVFREFQVFVKPVGARCNLACSYCYYLEKQDSVSSSPGGVMNDDILERYIHQHIEASTEPEIFFSWHGGEPTLAGLDFYKRAVAIQEAYKPEGSTIRNGIQTNGTLITDEWGSFFSMENFYVGISIDGPERYHNTNRTQAGGRGTFKEVMRGLEILKRHNVSHEFLCVVSNDNVSAPLEIYRFFKDLGASYITFLPLVEEDGDGSGKATPSSVGPLDFGKFLSAIFDEWIGEDIGKVKVQVFEEALRTAFRQEHTLCIFKPACGGVPVVEMNGDFYMCDHYVVPAHRSGNIADTPLATLLDHPRQKAFGEAKRDTLPRYCLECEVLDMCNGECPKNRFVTAPTGEPGLNYLCEGYRYFFNHCRPFVNEVARMWRSGG
ncbi:MAG: anaerobic sulfatase maturase [Bacteroidales bacterium]